MEKKREWKVCVTGGGSFIGSYLVNKLLQKGYTVHATLRSLKDAKTGILRGFPEAKEKLVLFEADLYSPHQFEAAIQGCDFVFHLATPYQHQPHSKQYKGVAEAATEGVKSIVAQCIKTGTVRRLIYTASVVAASPLKEDGSGYKHSMDESCWTPLNVSFPGSNLHKSYTDAKTLAERQLLSYENGRTMEVVSLVCGLVGGDTLLSEIPLSVSMLISQIKGNNDEFLYQSLKYLEDLNGKIPIVHVDDVCEAHIFCLETPSITGRFLLANSFASSSDLASYYFQNYPEFHFNTKYLEGEKREIEWGSRKLRDKGFVYKYELNMILDDCIKCAKRMDQL
ncbi:putative anthocyanidin reductase isoform X1 [Arachis stenosperma]|uniref:putative anthocyanidin reductase isoform X1 n=1 Tax=Arachis stenosperma TaxID=217475 RepID=UPI0025AD7545|nr:putative anthocyanidin reductase isoform X1 [Arachis stenosperma]